MIIVRKKVALQELAVSLFLILEFNPDCTHKAIIDRIRDRARNALGQAESYTGSLGEKDVQHFLRSRNLKFDICCGKDIIKGDIIRFIESVFDTEAKPPKRLGRRGISAEVLDVIDDKDGPQIVMEVLQCGSIWNIPVGKIIRRPLRIVTRFEVNRTRWDDEAEREVSKMEQRKLRLLPRAKLELVKREQPMSGNRPHS